MPPPAPGSGPRCEHRRRSSRCHVDLVADALGFLRLVKRPPGPGRRARHRQRPHPRGSQRAWAGGNPEAPAGRLSSCPRSPSVSALGSRLVYPASRHLPPRLPPLGVALALLTVGAQFTLCPSLLLLTRQALFALFPVTLSLPCPYLGLPLQLTLPGLLLALSFFPAALRLPARVLRHFALRHGAPGRGAAPRLRHAPRDGAGRLCARPRRAGGARAPLRAHPASPGARDPALRARRRLPPGCPPVAPERCPRPARSPSAVRLRLASSSLARGVGGGELRPLRSAAGSRCATRSRAAPSSTPRPLRPERNFPSAGPTTSARNVTLASPSPTSASTVGMQPSMTVEMSAHATRTPRRRRWRA
jgi:hypothetical protein